MELNGQDRLEERCATVLRLTEKGLACGDVGGGAMMDWRDVVGHVERYLGLESKNHLNGTG